MQIDHKMVNLAPGMAVNPLRWSLTGRKLCINDVWNCIVAMRYVGWLSPLRNPSTP